MDESATQQGAGSDDGIGSDFDVAGFAAAVDQVNGERTGTRTPDDRFSNAPDDDRRRQSQRDASGRFQAPGERDAGGNDDALDEAAQHVTDDELPARDDTQTQQTTDEAARKYRVKVNGEERDVPVADLIERYQREHGADQRFEQAAQMRRQSEEAISAAQAEKSRLLNQINTYLAAAQKFGPQMPSESMISEDPVGYLRAKAAFEQHQQQMQIAWQEQNRLQREQQDLKAADDRKRFEAGAAELQKTLPHWFDSDPAKQAKANQERAGIAEHMKSLGRTDTLQSPADVIAYRESYLFRQIMARAQGAGKRPPPAPRVERPGNGNRTSSGADGRDAALQRLSRSGSIEDAAAAFNFLQ